MNLPAEEPAEDAHREEEVPARQGIHRGAVRGDPAAGHDAMDMGVVEKALAPGMEDHEEAGSAPRWCGSAAMVDRVSEAARKRAP